MDAKAMDAKAMDAHMKDPVRTVLPGHCVRLAQERTRISPPGHPAAEPQIILIRDGDAVRAIEVVCTCGKRTRMQCVF